MSLAGQLHKTVSFVSEWLAVRPLGFPTRYVIDARIGFVALGFVYLSNVLHLEFIPAFSAEAHNFFQPCKCEVRIRNGLGYRQQSCML